MGENHRCVSYRTFRLVTGSLGAVVLLLMGALGWDTRAQGLVGQRITRLEGQEHPVGEIEYRRDHDKVNRLEVTVAHNTDAIDAWPIEMRAHEDRMLAAIAAIAAGR